MRLNTKKNLLKCFFRGNCFHISIFKNEINRHLSVKEKENTDENINFHKDISKLWKILIIKILNTIIY